MDIFMEKELYFESLIPPLSETEFSGF